MIRHRILPACAVLTVVLASGCASIGGADRLAEIRILPHESIHHGVDDAAALTTIGRRHLRAGDNAGAIDALDRALAAAPRHVDALNARAIALLRIGRHDAAAADLRAAIAVAPDEVHLHSNLGYVLMRDGQYHPAAGALRRAFALDPHDPRLRANWRELVARVGKAPDGATPSTPAAIPAAQADAVATARPTGHQAVHNLHFGAPPALAVAVPTPPQGQARVRTQAPAATPSVHVSTGGPRSGDARSLSAHTIRPAVGILRVSRHARFEPALADTARIEVSNGNGVRGFARRTSQGLRRQGARVIAITNADHFGHDTTTVYYRPGHEDAARQIAAALPGPTPVLEALDTLTGIEIRVVLGADAVESPGQQPAKRRIVG